MGPFPQWSPHGGSPGLVLNQVLERRGLERHQRQPNGNDREVTEIPHQDIGAVQVETWRMGNCIRTNLNGIVCRLPLPTLRASSQTWYENAQITEVPGRNLRDASWNCSSRPRAYRLSTCRSWPHRRPLPCPHSDGPRTVGQRSLRPNGPNFQSQQALVHGPNSA